MSDNGYGLGELAAALAKAQAAFPKVLKDRTAKISSARGEYSYKYADLGSLLEAVRPALVANGLALVQPIETTEQGMVLHTMLLHTSGAHLDSFYPLAAHERPQEMGSEITYSRRYAASALLGVASEDDDDGAAAQAAPERQRGRQQGPRIGVPADQVGNPDRKSTPTTDAEVAQAFPADAGHEERDLRPEFLKGNLTCFCGKKVFKRKDGSGWFCWTDRGGCGRNWKAAPVIVNINRETGEVTAVTPADPKAVTAELGALTTRARKLAELVGLTPDEMKSSWKTYCGDTTKETANVEDVRQYIGWLETRWSAKQKPA